MSGWHGRICVATRTMTIYGAYMNLQRMIRKYGFELLVYPKINRVLLLAMRNDPNEMTDLARQPQYQLKVKTCFKDLKELQKTMNHKLGL